MSKVKTIKQVRYLLSKVSPLSASQKETLKEELHKKEVKVVKTKKK